MDAWEHDVEQRLGTRRVALGGAQPHGRQEAVGPADGVGRELRRAEEEVGGRLRPTPVEHPLAGELQRAGEVLVRSRNGGGAMPGAPVGVLAVERVGEGPVGPTALGRRRAVVDRRADQRVAEVQPGRERHEAGRLDARDRVLPRRCRQPRRPVEERRVAQPFRRREQEDGPHRRRQQAGPGGELVLE